MISEEYINAIHRISNHPSLKDSSVVHDEDVKRNDVHKVLKAVMLFQQEYDTMVTP